MFIDFEMGHFLKMFINFGVYSVLSGNEGELIVGEFHYGLFDAVHIRLKTSRLNHGVH